MSWTLAAGVASAWQLTTADESFYEFQVRGKNATGAGPWSATEDGYIRPKLVPVFVSQSGIPAKIGVGQTFSFTQVWQNLGTETWTGASYGTGHYGSEGAIQWGVPFTAFSGSTTTSASVTTTMTATAPATAGTYTLQRVMQKSGVAYQAASPAASIIVLDTPKCTAVTPDLTTTYNPNATISVSLVGASSVEAAAIRVWGELQGEPNGTNYQMTFNGTNWVKTFPIASHLTAGESKVNIVAAVSNSMFPVAASCANAAVSFQQLPVPQVNLTPVLGSFSDAGAPGFVARRSNGEFATATVDLGSFNSLKVKIELLAANLIDPLGAPLNGVNPGVATPLSASSTVTGADNAAWGRYPAVIKVSYADPDAASQGKVAQIPVTLTIPPVAMQVSTSSEPGLPASVNSRVHNAGSYDEAAFGVFTGALRTHPEQAVVRDFVATDSSGAWASLGLDYSTLYNQNMVAVARVAPPAGVTLLEVIEYTSAPFLLPVQAPATVSATDGSREDDVAINWTAPATGSGIRYRLFRGDTEITQAGGIAALEFTDIPPERGTIYSYRVKTAINGVNSQNETADNGHIPACRAARLIGASVNADMSAVTGLVERWGCLADLTATGAIDAGGTSGLPFEGAGLYRSFSYPLPTGLVDGAHVLHLGLDSTGVGLNASRTYDVPFTLNRSSITINGLTILYNGQPATNGVEANSIGRFGIRMEGGSGIGFAEEVK